MYVRLGFAIAVNVDPDVLVIDEVLAVGDEQFQAKCLDRIRTFQEEGRTILFVSHNADQIRAICDRAVVLDERPDADRRVARRGGARLPRAPRRSPPPTTLGAPNRQLRAVRNVEILGVDVVGGAQLRTGDPLHLRVGLKTQEPVAAGPRARDPQAQRRAAGAHRPRRPERAASRSPRARASSPPTSAASTSLDGAYQVNVGIVGPNGTTIFDWKECAASIEVTYEGRASGTLAHHPRRSPSSRVPGRRRRLARSGTASSLGNRPRRPRRPSRETSTGGPPPSSSRRSPRELP